MVVNLSMAGSLLLGLNPNKLDMYNEVAVWNDPQKTVVVYPYFTYVAYNEPGFYTYYRGDCDELHYNQIYTIKPDVLMNT